MGLYLGLILTIFVDRLTKLWAVHSLLPGRSRPFLPGLSLTLSRNSGAAFSLLAGREKLLLLLTLLFLLAGFIYSLRLRDTQARWAAGFILGGGLGNFWDRLVSGQVVDFLDLHFWPVFNLADLFIVLGALWFFFRLEKRR